MDGFEKHGLDEDAFGENSNLTSGLRTFDAFPKTKKTYTQASSRGGQWTVVLTLLCLFLTVNELKSWWSGTETHHFSVERGVSHELQMNLDIVVRMSCSDLHVNVQDIALDHIIAGELLTKEDTNWERWVREPPAREKGYVTLNSGFVNVGPGGTLNSPPSPGELKRKRAEEEDSHVGHVLGHVRESKSTKRKFPKSPRLKRSERIDSCRIYGSLESNKIQGEFHITARGHGYHQFGDAHTHLDHSLFNFTHFVNELSFGPHYPNLLNPLDNTLDATEANFYKFQYYLSIVPTIYTKRRVATKNGILDPRAVPQPATLDLQPDLKKRDKDGGVHHVANPDAHADGKSVFTNQYAAQSQSRQISDRAMPGIFFKYDIEPILLIVSEQRDGFLGVLVKLVNVISGVLVGGGWLFQLTEWAVEVWGRRRKARSGLDYGVLHGRSESKSDFL